ncbi:hypothetical protein Tco_1581962, partial [Tanacetum coccineum]
IVLTDKLVTYDLEKKTIGWTEYNCKDTPFVNALLLLIAMLYLPYLNESQMNES